MGVLVKKSDVESQWHLYQAAQAASLEVAGVFERACNERRPDEECQAAWAAVGEAEVVLEREWQAYRKIAPAKMRTK